MRSVLTEMSEHAPKTASVTLGLPEESGRNFSVHSDQKWQIAT